MSEVETIAKLRDLNSKFDKVRVENAKWEGQKEQILKDLKSKFGISSLKEAMDLKIKLDEELVSKSEELQVIVEKMEKVLQGVN